MSSSNSSDQTKDLPKKHQIGPNYELCRARRWINKESGKEVKALPWFQPLADDSRMDMVGLMKEVAPELFTNDVMKDFEVYSGLVLRVGWLIRNEHDVWFGVAKGVEDQFEDLGFYGEE